MKVGSSGDWLWNDDARCVDGLPYPCQVDAPGDLLDEKGSQAFFSELPRDAEVVDLG